MRLAMNAVLVPDRDKAASRRKPRSLSELRRADRTDARRRRHDAPVPDPIFSGAAPDRGPTTLKREVEDSGGGCVVRKSSPRPVSNGCRDDGSDCAFLTVRAEKSLAVRKGRSPIEGANPSGAGHLFETGYRRANRPRVSMRAAKSIAGEFKHGDIQSGRIGCGNRGRIRLL